MVIAQKKSVSQITASSPPGILAPPLSKYRMFWKQHESSLLGRYLAAVFFYRSVVYFCSRLQIMTMPVESADASKLSSQLKLTSSTGPP